MQPNATFDGCEPMHEKHLSRDWIAIVVALASLGIIATSIVCSVFVKFAETSLIKASEDTSCPWSFLSDYYFVIWCRL